MMNESNISGNDIIKLDNSPQTYYGTSSNLRHSRQVYRSKRESLNDYAPISKPMVTKNQAINEDSLFNIKTDRNSELIMNSNNTNTKFSLAGSSKDFTGEQTKINYQRVSSNLVQRRSSK